MLRGIRLIIFDLDGTLVDAYPAISASFNYVMQKLGYPPQRPSVIRRAVGWGDTSLLKPFVKANDLKVALALYRRHHARELLAGSRVFPGVKPLLRGLKAKGFLLAVASNRPTRFCRILIRHLGLARYFDQVLCGDAVRKGKPHPELLNRIMKRFSLKAAETLYVGDMVVDAQAGRRAGVKTLLVTTGSHGKEELARERPYRIIPKAADLAGIV